MSSNIATEPQKRAPQQRAEDTRKALLDAAIEAFSTLGYDGVSIRALEGSAGVQRGAAAYHFGTKKDLWKRSVDQILDRFTEQFLPLDQMIRDLDQEGRLRTAITVFVRLSAENPQLNRLMVQEGRHDTWRLAYVLDSFVRARLDWLNDVLEFMQDPHMYYMMIGASTFVFDVEHECRSLFGIDPTTDEFIRDHAARVADMAIYSYKIRQSEEENGVQ